ncbi:MAG: MobA/MobL family protein [Acidobacteriota bacterium]
MHGGRDEKGREHNPHAHLMFSERRNDGIERSREQWFRRADSAHPERGGAPKSRTFHGRDWVEGARGRWASMTNAALERAGRSERVDHRSYARQGVDREPGEHFGPSAPHMVVRGEDHERLAGAASVRDHHDSIRAIDAEIARLESARSALLHGELSEIEQDKEWESGQRDHSRSPSGQPVDDDRSWGR